MDLLLPALSIPVALAAVAVIGYLVGRFQRPALVPAADATRRELKRAQAIVLDLEKIAQRVRRELALHHANLAAFKRRVGELSHATDSADWKLLCDEAERLLKPTQDLAMQLAHAYDGIRQQSSRLMTFSGQRCDPLTGLCNRQALDETLHNYLTMHRRYGMLFSVAVFDLDHFKNFNGEHGHVHGDRLLKQIASLLDQQARETDLVTRSGGEEFIIVLPGTELAGGTAFAERMRAIVARCSALTVSAGVAMVAEGDDVKLLLTRADSALYAAKAAGRNCVWCHNGEDAYPSASQDLMSDGAAGIPHRGLRESLAAPTTPAAPADSNPAQAE
jgi:diguanylate cyclase (GGDEF)-like protein